jgi:hypothetical protein
MVDEDDDGPRTSWARFRDLPDEILKDLPSHIRSTFAAARRHGFEVELLSAGVRVPAAMRAPRRFVLISDDGGMGEPAGPVAFDLKAIALDVRQCSRIFIISMETDAAVFDAAYAGAVADLARGFDVAVVVETEKAFEAAWVRTLTALRGAAVAAAAGTAA